MWKYSTAKSNLGAPKLESLPATDEYFFQNLKRSHLQIAVERRSLNADPRTVDICFYRCVKEDETKFASCSRFLFGSRGINKGVQKWLSLEKLAQIEKLLL